MLVNVTIPLASPSWVVEDFLICSWRPLLLVDVGRETS